ncbi:MAG: NADH-quinone oxidoreductase subunit J [Acidimicrobiia bacterium]|nr:NADH-quinone oxidoreductase subunit J [Acidimicrobiia bacterium]
MVELILFVILGAVAIFGALSVVFAKNPVYGAMGLMLTLFSLAVFYVMHLAHLVAAVQIIVYAGAVMTLFLFVIMLIGVDRDEDTSEKLPMQRQLVSGLGLVVVLIAGVAVVGGRFDWVRPATSTIEVNGTVQEAGLALFTDWILPFEATSLLLIIAAAGAIALAYYGPRRRDREDA